MATSGLGLSCQLSKIALMIRHPGGSTSRHTVSAHGISPTRLIISMRGFVHVGSSCSVILHTWVDLEPVQYNCRVTACIHIANRDHEVILAFDTPIDPVPFLPAPDTSEVTPEALAGSVLLIEQEGATCFVVQQALKPTRVRLTCMDFIDEAMPHLLKTSFDLVIFDADLCDADDDIVMMMRCAGYNGPAVAIATSNGSTSGNAPVSQVDATLGKPLNAAQLMLVLGQLLPRSADRLSV